MDLIRKREKIQQQDIASGNIAVKRDQSVLRARQLLDQQRKKYQEVERREERKSASLFASIMSAGRKKIKATNDNASDATDTAKFFDNQTEEDTAASNQAPREDDLERRREKLEKKQEEVLTREFKTNISYAMFPKMISQKAKVLKTGTETLKTQVNRLEDILRRTSTDYQHQRERTYDVAATDSGDTVAMVDNKVKGSVGEESTTFDSLANNEPRLLSHQRDAKGEETMAVEMTGNENEAY